MSGPVDFTEFSNRRFFFLKPAQWLISLLATVLAAWVSHSYTGAISPWISFSMGLTVLTVCHMAFAAQSVLALPHIAILIASLQYIMAAWISYVWPPTNPSYDIGVHFTEYLEFAGPAVASAALGWAISFVGFCKRTRGSTEASPALYLGFDVLSGIGVMGLILQRLLQAESVAFALLLVGNLRYVGVFARMIVNGPGWRWRLAVMFALQVLAAAGDAMFHDLLLWGLWGFAVWVFSFAPRPRVVVTALLIGLVCLPALQESKWRLREGGASADDPWGEYDPSSENRTTAEKTAKWIGYLASAVWETARLNLDPQFLSDLAVRYNQGWIIDHIRATVPAIEPFAEGETLKDAAVGAAVPRFLDPYKAQAGGRVMMPRYAGIYLGETTSMDVGFVGEMYINFGERGGIIGCGIYALVLGLLFRFFCQWALKTPWVLGFAPFIFYAAGKAEDDIAFLLNWMVKAAIVFIPIYLLFRLLLRPRPTGLEAPIWRKAFRQSTATR